jgi:hypothetical protein
LALVVVLPVPLTPTMETTQVPPGNFAQFGLVRRRAKAFFNFRARDGKIIQSRAALRFIASLTAATICVVMAMPRSAAMSAASISSSDSAVSWASA